MRGIPLDELIFILVCGALGGAIIGVFAVLLIGAAAELLAGFVVFVQQHDLWATAALPGAITGGALAFWFAWEISADA